ncbi:MAG: transketolase family protein [Candidatus Edwardsbacteria bacterium]|nr:transketolase family protein [Candidatus Edwardsbacteria bacterium]MBU1576526.1 transketolase family protein [Candidatus Edwardsbacteria bacterium]MBU2464373.1 transketolase family protein [Candidatus Edwardsbacteria bacterium]MBU2593695.1 transketolase family protein [Candidatus Edwardsbacteria bacterium]
MEQQPTRFGYADALLELGARDKRVVVLDADLAKSTLTSRFAEKYPKRFFDIGIAEQNMLGIAGGLSLTGKIPFVTTYGVFLAGRAWDQIRTSICYADLNVKLAGAHGGLSVGPDGATHQALEEISIMRVLPNMKVIIPCDTHQAWLATLEAAKISGPVYIRLGREPIPVITTLKTPFKFGKAQIMRQGRDVTIVACGLMVYLSLLAAQKLAKEGISCEVINLHTIKPIDRKALIASAKKTEAVVTAEEHQLAGGMGSAVAEALALEFPVPVEMVGVKDTFGESGQPWELMKKYHLMDADIYNSVLKVVKRKRRDIK